MGVVQGGGRSAASGGRPDGAGPVVAVAEGLPVRTRAELEVAAGLWPMRRALMVAAGSAVGGLTVLTVAMVVWVTWANHGHALKVSDLLDVLKLVLASVAGAGALVALVIAYRKQRLAEEAHRLAEAAEQRAGQGALRESTKLHTDRFTAATAQLGSGSSAVQLAGVHALAGLADDAPTRPLQQTCIDVLCAFLRMPYDPEPAELPDDATQEQAREHAAALHAYRSLREVRHTVIRVIAAHLRADAEVSWQGHDFDFTGVTFDGGDFTHAVFTAAPDHGLHGRVSFRGATFTNGQVDFRDAQFSGGMVDFGDARFSGGQVDFAYAQFAGGQVDFLRAQFSSGTVDFTGAQFSSGMVAFGDARFSGGQVGFAFAKFSGSWVDFLRAQFSGSTVVFGDAQFSRGQVDFVRAQFSGSEVIFVRARFSGGTVDFASAVGDAPAGLVEAAGRSAPGVVRMPAAWSPSAAPSTPA